MKYIFTLKVTVEDNSDYEFEDDKLKEAVEDLVDELEVDDIKVEVLKKEIE